METGFHRIVGDLARTLESFALPAIIVDKGFAVHWSNRLAKSLYPHLTGTDSLAAALAEYDRAAILAGLRESGGYAVQDFIPMSGTRLSFSPLMDGEELAGAVLMLLGGGVDVGTQEICQASRTASAITDGIRQAVGDLFAIMDNASLKASIMDAGWISPNFERIGYHGYRILRVADNITAYSLIQGGALDLRREITDLFALLEGLRGIVTDLAAMAGIPLTFELPDMGAYVLLDNRYFELALFNLLHNAFYFTRPGNAVKVRAKKRQERIFVQIEDKGAGIPAEVLPQVFRPYYAYNAGGKQATVGLGLTVARQLLEAMHGNITIDSEPGRGTTVTLELRENIFSHNMPFAQRDPLGRRGRFSGAYRGLMDVMLSPYRE